MPKIGMEPIRREAVVKAAIAEIAAQGSLDVTVSAIAKRAGMSSGLAHHYFGGKTEIFLAAMRHVLSRYRTAVRLGLGQATTPRSRLEAIVKAGFLPENFSAEVVSAWLNFYVLAQSEPEAHRLLTLYRRRLQSNLLHSLRPLLTQPEPAAERIAGLIDGLYLHAVQHPDGGATATAHVLKQLDFELQQP